MNFVDSAITLLHEAGRPMGVEELCELAMNRELLDKPGANPLRSMKTRLTVELKKGDESRVRKVDDETWELCDGVEVPGAGAEEAVKPAKTKKAAAKPKKAKAAQKDDAKAAKSKSKNGARKSTKKDAPEEVDEKAATPEEEAEAKPRRTRKRRGKATKKDADAEAKVDAASAPDDAEESSDESVEVIEPPVELTPEEQALVDLYSADSQGTRSVAELNEYSDELTKDEDRPMLPEIRAERRPHRRERTRERRRRRTRGEKAERSERSSERQAEPRNERARDISGVPISVDAGEVDGHEHLVRACRAVLAALPTGQAMPVRQLTQTLSRKGLLGGKHEAMWRMVKGALLVSEQKRRARGLRPFVIYRGKDLFSAGATVGRSKVEVAAMALNRAAETFAAAVETEVADRLTHLAPSMLERIAYVYLQGTGWTDISWVKRVKRSSYAMATAPGAIDETLISVCSGDEAVDRRAIGELRAGLHAKDLSNGLLLSPAQLGDEADTELAKEGGYVRVLCGTDFISELVAREIGVTRHHFQLPEIDQRFFDGLLS